jgi:hypothetical protein
VLHEYTFEANYSKPGYSGTTILDQPESDILLNAAIKACDPKTGLMLDDRACEQKFNFNSVECSTSLKANCLTAAQLAVVRKVLTGPVDPQGQLLFPGGYSLSSAYDWSDPTSVAASRYLFIGLLPCLRTRTVGSFGSSSRITSASRRGPTDRPPPTCVPPCTFARRCSAGGSLRPRGRRLLSITVTGQAATARTATTTSTTIRPADIVFPLPCPLRADAMRASQLDDSRRAAEKCRPADAQISAECCSHPCRRLLLLIAAHCVAEPDRVSRSAVINTVLDRCRLHALRYGGR